ncbi:MAG: ABC transporter permease [bacterium]
MFERIKHLVKKEFIQVLRNKRLRFFLVAPPVIQLMLFGYVVSLDVRNVSMALYDLDKSRESRELVRRMESSGYFTVKYLPESTNEIRDLLDRGKVTCAMQINSGFSKDLRRKIPADIQIIFDGTDSNTAIVAMGYINRIVSKYSLDLTGETVKSGLSKIDFRTRAWYNPELKSRNYFVPGVMASIILLTCLSLTSTAIVREREIGTMEQLMVTPIKPFELILGKTIPFAIVGFLDMVLVLIVGVLWFRIPIKGSIPLLALGTAAYLLPALGIGLFISTVAKTQQQAMMLMNLFNNPAMMLSGFTFPIENMPLFFQYLTYLTPLRYFIIIIRGIFLKGNGFGILWPQILALVIFGVIVITISAMRFKKRLG